MDHDSGPVGDLAAAYWDSAAAIVSGCPSESACHEMPMGLHVTDHEERSLSVSTVFHIHTELGPGATGKQKCSMHKS